MQLAGAESVPVWQQWGAPLPEILSMLAAVSGLAALLSASPVLLQVIQWGGVFYICRMGWGLVRATSGVAVTSPAEDTGPGQAFRRAFAVGLANPKVIMFFMAFFPLFMTPATRTATLGVMMVHVSVICLLYQTFLVLVGSRIARLLAQRGELRLLAGRLSGVALIGFGLKLALEKR
jgi:leucine efflux protein